MYHKLVAVQNIKSLQLLFAAVLFVNHLQDINNIADGEILPNIILLCFEHFQILHSKMLMQDETVIQKLKTYISKTFLPLVVNVSLDHDTMIP